MRPPQKHGTRPDGTATNRTTTMRTTTMADPQHCGSAIVVSETLRRAAIISSDRAHTRQPKTLAGLRLSWFSTVLSQRRSADSIALFYGKMPSSM